jgi:ABC-type multidrug transport system ATPase subunit
MQEASGSSEKPRPRSDALLVRETAAHALYEIEDLIAAASETDALSRLQDLVADFAPSSRDEVMALRARHEQLRSSLRNAGTDPTVINRLRSDILEIASDVALAVVTGRATPSQPKGFPLVERESADQPDKTESADDASTPSILPPKKKSGAKLRSLNDDVVCRLENVTRRYAKGAFKLEPISLEIRRGEITAIAGRNASGKTTLLRMILGELIPSGGHVSYPALEQTGKDWVAIKSQIASMAQLPERWHGRLLHNLNYVAAIYGRSDQDLEKFIDWYLARFDLMRYRDSNWDEISGGYKIRFELVRALLTQPRLLVLDEPLAYLDVVARDRFLRDLRALADSIQMPLPILITSQHLNEIEAVADQIVLLDDGAVRYAGPVSDIAKDRKYRIVEIAIDAPRAAVETALSGTHLAGVETTVEGYLLAFPKQEPTERVFARLAAAFGERFIMMRDITGSVRAIMSDLGV